MGRVSSARAVMRRGSAVFSCGGASEAGHCDWSTTLELRIKFLILI